MDSRRDLVLLFIGQILDSSDVCSKYFFPFFVKLILWKEAVLLYAHVQQKHGGVSANFELEIDLAHLPLECFGVIVRDVLWNELCEMLADLL